MLHWHNFRKCPLKLFGIRFGLLRRLTEAGGLLCWRVLVLFGLHMFKRLRSWIAVRAVVAAYAEYFRALPTQALGVCTASDDIAIRAITA
jgi:hypothetical protein